MLCCSAIATVNCWCWQLPLIPWPPRLISVAMLIPWYRIRQRRGEWSESRELLQLQQISGNCLVRRGGMGALMTDGGQTLMTVSRTRRWCAVCVRPLSCSHSLTDERLRPVTAYMHLIVTRWRWWSRSAVAEVTIINHFARWSRQALLTEVPCATKLQSGFN